METPPIVPDPERQTRNNTPLIIGIVIAVLICCCCIITVPLLRWLWFNGDSLLGVSIFLQPILG